MAVHVPQAVLGATVNDAGVSGSTPQLGWPELLGQLSTVEVPVAGRPIDVWLRVSEQALTALKFAVTVSGALMATVVEDWKDSLRCRSSH
jgi:hypothetical protein